MALTDSQLIFIANVAIIALASTGVIYLVMNNEPWKLNVIQAATIGKMSVIDQEAPALQIGDSTILSKGDIVIIVGIVGSFASISSGLTIFIMRGKKLL